MTDGALAHTCPDATQPDIDLPDAALVDKLSGHTCTKVHSGYRGQCGICKARAVTFACFTCRVRFCNPNKQSCCTRHLNGDGKPMPKHTPIVAAKLKSRTLREAAMSHESVHDCTKLRVTGPCGVCVSEEATFGCVACNVRFCDPSVSDCATRHFQCFGEPCRDATLEGFSTGSGALADGSCHPSLSSSCASETLGFGGCVAVALSKLEVFPSEVAAKNALNAQIRTYTARCRPEHRTPEHVGVPNDHWHPEVVKMAVIETGHHFHKLDLDSVDLVSKLESGNFLIDGVLNDSFEREMQRFDTDPDDESSPRTDEARWRHAIAVSDGQILEKEFEMSADWLWLSRHRNNRPDPDKGYMYKVLKVYHIFKCTSPQGCKFTCTGQCAPAVLSRTFAATAAQLSATSQDTAAPASNPSALATAPAAALPRTFTTPTAASQDTFVARAAHLASPDAAQPESPGAQHDGDAQGEPALSATSQDTAASTAMPSRLATAPTAALPRTFTAPTHASQDTFATPAAHHASPDAAQPDAAQPKSPGAQHDGDAQGEPALSATSQDTAASATIPAAARTAPAQRPMHMVEIRWSLPSAKGTVTRKRGRDEGGLCSADGPIHANQQVTSSGGEALGPRLEIGNSMCNVGGLSACASALLEGRDVSKGLLMIGQLSMLGCEHACWVIGNAFVEGLYGLQKNAAEAEKWFREMPKCKLKNATTLSREKAANWLLDHGSPQGTVRDGPVQPVGHTPL